MKRLATGFLALVATVALAFQPASAQVFDTKAGQAYLVDSDSGAVLFDKAGRERIPPASLAKLMTMEVVFHALEIGRLKLTDQFVVSEEARRVGGAESGGSTMFARPGTSIALEDLIRGVIIQSANDGCVIIAENMAGSEAAFAGLMNERAAAIGLADSHFTNPTGLPDPEQYVTAADLAALARHIIRSYPEHYRYYSETEFTWNKITQQNRNPLLKMDIGADGMKTGFTEASGYAIIGTVKRGEQRLIAVLSGMASAGERAEEARKILDWGFRAFERVTMFPADTVIGSARVFGGVTGEVGLVGREPIVIYKPKGFSDQLKARIVYDGPLRPPVAAGQQVARLQVLMGETLSQTTPLFAAQDVASGGLVRRSTDALWELSLGWLPL